MIVDLIGSDGYNFYPRKPGSTWNSFETVYRPTQDFAVRRATPWMAVEWGAQEDPDVTGRKGQWIIDTLATAKTWPELKGVDPLRRDQGWLPLDHRQLGLFDGRLRPDRQGRVPRPRDRTDSEPQPPRARRPTRPSPSPSPSPEPEPVAQPEPVARARARARPPARARRPARARAPAPVRPRSRIRSTEVLAGPPSWTRSNSGGGSGAAFDLVNVDDRAELTYDSSRAVAGLAAKHEAGPGETSFYGYAESFGTLTSTGSDASTSGSLDTRGGGFSSSEPRSKGPRA